MIPPVERRHKTPIEKFNAWVPVLSLILNFLCMTIFALGIWVGHNNEIIQVWKNEQHVTKAQFDQFVSMLNKRLDTIESRLTR